MQLRKRQRGISLVEVMLGMTVAIAMTVFMGKMQVMASNDMRAKTVAESMQSLQNVAYQYFLSNRAAILEVAKTGTNANQYCVVGASPTAGTGGTTANNLTNKTCSLDINWLKWKKFAPADLRTSNSYSQPLYVVYRLVDATTEDFEMLIVAGTSGGTELTTSIEEASLAADLMGGNGGFIPAQTTGTCLTTNACGTNGGWKVVLSNFITAPVTVKLGSIASYSFIPKAAGVGAAAATPGPTAPSILGRPGWPTSISCGADPIRVLFTVRSSATGAVNYYNTASGYTLVFNDSELLTAIYAPGSIPTYGPCAAGVSTVTSLRAIGRADY